MITQLNIHLILAVEESRHFFAESLKEPFYKFLTGLLEKNGCITLALMAHRDHLHLFFELNPEMSLRKVVREVRLHSSQWINSHEDPLLDFSWQEVWAAFSVSHSKRDEVIQMISSQHSYHRLHSTRDELVSLLSQNKVGWSERDLFRDYG